MAKVKKQAEIPGTERKKVAELDHAAEAYVSARDERMELTEREVEARSALISVMRKHNLTVYRDEDAEPPLIVTLVPGEDKGEGDAREGRGRGRGGLSSEPRSRRITR